MKFASQTFGIAVHRPIFESLESRRLFATTLYSWDNTGGGGEVFEQYPGTSPSWNPGGDFITVEKGAPATFTLSGLPEHKAIRIDVAFESFTAPFGDPGDTLTMNVSSGPQGSHTFLPTEPGDCAWTPVFAHTGNSVSVTFTAGDDYEEGETAWPTYIRVEMPDVFVSVESETMTIDDPDGPEQVTVSAFDEFANPVEGLTLNVTEYDSNVIQPQQSSVTIGSNGTATLDVTGVSPGTSNLKVQSASGLQAQAMQAANFPTITLEGRGDIYQGEEVELKATITKADGVTPIKEGTRPQVVSADPAKLKIKSIGPADDEGVSTIIVEGRQPTPFPQGVNVSVKLPGGMVPVVKKFDVTGVVLTLDKAAAVVNVNGQITVTAKVTALGQPISGITLVTSLTPVGQNKVEMVGAASGTTDANGEVTFILKGVAATGGVPSKLNVFAGDESKTCEITVQ